MTRRPASLSLDLDNKWSYLKTHGDEGWEEYPSYFDLVVPRALRVLEKLDLRITFFVVGRDAEAPENQSALRSIVDAGHEIGNHSFNHEPWLHLYEPEEIEEELSRTEQAIERFTNQKPLGFRGPGYSSSPELLRSLARRGYRYDASKLPTFIGPVARAYYLVSTCLGKQELEKRKQLFGSWRDGFCPIKPFWWSLTAEGVDYHGERLLEIPVTTMPLFRLPFHFSYLHYLSQFSTSLAWMYWRMSLTLCRSTGVEPSLLLHPLDFLDANDEPALSFFPGMRVDRRKKWGFLEDSLREFCESYRVLPMSEHAESICDRGDLKSMQLSPTPNANPQQRVFVSDVEPAVEDSAQDSVEDAYTHA